MRTGWGRKLACAGLALLVLCTAGCAAQEERPAAESGLEAASSASKEEREPSEAASAEESGAGSAVQEESDAPGEDASQSASQNASQPPRERGTLAVHSAQEAAAELERALAAIGQPELLDLSQLGESWEDPAITVQNLYYGILAEHPAYKYAWQLSVQLQEDGLLRCDFDYMPYVTGQYPAEFEGIETGSLGALIAAARAHLGEEGCPVRLTDPTMTVDDMARALQQAGGSYLLCALNRDGTAITYTPLNNLTREEALAALEETEALAGEVAESCLTPGMTQREQAEALYTWLTENVRYDQRYYADFASMPYDSATARGALADHTAICGGYAQALQLLFEQAGIPCLTVSGVSSGENHMWNLALLDGRWLYFDATSDRGMAQFGFRKFAVTGEELTGYTWDEDWMLRLASSLGGA